MWKKSSILLLTLCTLSLIADEPSSSSSHELALAPNNFSTLDGLHMIFQTEVIFWNAQIDGLYYAQTGGVGQGSVDFNGRLKKTHPHWDPGARISFGGNMNYDGWDLLFVWTWYANHAHSSMREMGLSLWSRPDANAAAAVSGMHAYWNFNLNILDVEMGRASLFGEHLTIRPFFAVRAAWIGQDYKTRGNYLSPVADVKTHADSDYEGAGLRAGAELRYQVLGGWSIVGLASGSLLYGKFDSKFYQYNNDILAAKSIDSFFAGLSTVQASLGLQWDTFFKEERYHFSGKISWEQNYWFGVNRMQHWKSTLNGAILDQDCNNLSLQGGVLSARLDF